MFRKKATFNGIKLLRTKGSKIQVAGKGKVNIFESGIWLMGGIRELLQTKVFFFGALCCNTSSLFIGTR